MSTKISDTFRNLTSDLPACSAVQRRSNSSGKLEVETLIVIAKY
jgi:hypothetical protein